MVIGGVPFKKIILAKIAIKSGDKLPSFIHSQHEQRKYVKILAFSLEKIIGGY